MSQPVASGSELGGSAFMPVFRNESKLVWDTKELVVVLILMPLGIISMLKTTMEASLLASGETGVNGAEQVVPGQALLFGFFLVSFIGMTFFREHGWGTWDRLRTSRATRTDILVGKTLPWAIVGLVQLLALFALGMVVFDLKVPDVSGLLGIGLVAVAWMIFVSAFSVAMVALFNSIQMVSAISNLGAMVFSALGGALVPAAQLPGWARAIGPAIPTHWAMEGFNAVFIDNRGVSGVLVPCAVLLAFAAGFGAIAQNQFKFDAVKTTWA